MRRFAPFLALMSLLCLSSLPLSAQRKIGPTSQGIPPHFVLRDLGKLPSIWPLSMNDSGQIVGTALLGTVARRRMEFFLYDPATGFSSLGNLGGDALDVRINNAGQIAGISYNSTDLQKRKAYYFFKDTFVAQPVLISPAVFGKPLALNNQGAMLGCEQNGVFLYQNGILTTLTGLPPQTWITGLNDLSQITGAAIPVNPLPATYGRPSIWQATGESSLLDLPSSFPLPFPVGVGTALNNRGKVVGGFRKTGVYNSYFAGFLWNTVNGSAQWLGQLSPGEDETVWPTSVNDRSEVVGWSQVLRSTDNPLAPDFSGIWQRARAFYWAKGKIYDLAKITSFPNPGWIIPFASTVNASGHILCWAVDGNAQAHLALLEPVSLFAHQDYSGE